MKWRDVLLKICLEKELNVSVNWQGEYFGVYFGNDEYVIARNSRNLFSIHKRIGPAQHNLVYKNISLKDVMQELFNEK